MATSDAGEPKLLRAVFGHLSKVLNESNTASLMEELDGIMKLREVLRAAAVPGERLLSTIESVLLLLRSMGRFRSPQAGGGAHGPRAQRKTPERSGRPLAVADPALDEARLALGLLDQRAEDGA